MALVDQIVFRVLMSSSLVLGRMHLHIWKGCDWAITLWQWKFGSSLGAPTQECSSLGTVVRIPSVRAKPCSLWSRNQACRCVPKISSYPESWRQSWTRTRCTYTRPLALSSIALESSKHSGYLKKYSQDSALSLHLVKYLWEFKNIVFNEWMNR